MLMILWPLLSGLRNCRALHILFIRRAALCPFFLRCCLTLFPALCLVGVISGLRQLSVCALFRPLMNIRFAAIIYVSSTEMNEKEIFVCSLALCKANSFYLLHVSFMNLLTYYNLKGNLIRVGIYTKGPS